MRVLHEEGPRQKDQSTSLNMSAIGFTFLPTGLKTSPWQSFVNNIVVEEVPLPSKSSYDSILRWKGNGVSTAKDAEYFQLLYLLVRGLASRTGGYVMVRGSGGVASLQISKVYDK